MLTDGAMGLKLGKVVHLITPHLHTNFESFTSYSSQNIPVEMLFLWRKKKGKKSTLFWSANYTSTQLWTWNLTCLWTLLPNMYMYMYTFKSQLHCIMKIWPILWFPIIKMTKIECILVCKIHILQLNDLKFSENAYLDKAYLKI